MVNTFICDSDYRESAKNLDLLRLRKQCIEALQILHILEQLHSIAKLENWRECCPFFNTPRNLAIEYLQKVEWVRETRSKYLKLSYRYVCINDHISKIPVEELPYYRVDSSTKAYYTVKDKVIVWISGNGSLPPYSRKLTEEERKIYDLSLGKRLRSKIPVIFSRDKILLPHDSIYTLGFSQHAIVKMWIGYEDALRSYINSHIEEYCSRKTKNGNQCSINIAKQIIKCDKIIHPWWIEYTDYVILSHRASLLRKERIRNEKKWYWNNPKFISLSQEWLNRGYLWAGNLSEDDIVNIIERKNLDLSEMCAPIAADTRPAKSQKYLRNKYTYCGPYTLDQSGYVKLLFIRK